MLVDALAAPALVKTTAPSAAIRPETTRQALSAPVVHAMPLVALDAVSDDQPSDRGFDEQLTKLF